MQTRVAAKGKAQVVSQEDKTPEDIGQGTPQSAGKATGRDTKITKDTKDTDQRVIRKEPVIRSKELKCPEGTRTAG
jgi:hypothetical protein